MDIDFKAFARALKRRLRFMRTFPVGVLAPTETRRMAWVYEIMMDHGYDEHVLAWTQRGPECEVAWWLRIKDRS